MTRDIEEIREVLEADCSSDKKCEMILNIVNGSPHYFKEPKIGRWVRYNNGKYHWYLCSCCDAMAGSDEKMMAYKYCPNCGAKMKSEGARNDLVFSQYG